VVGVQGSCLHRPKNWLKQLIDLWDKAGIQSRIYLEKEKAAAGAVQWSPDSGGSLLR
jgi:hypothetical protein